MGSYGGRVSSVECAGAIKKWRQMMASPHATIHKERQLLGAAQESVNRWRVVTSHDESFRIAPDYFCGTIGLAGPPQFRKASEAITRRFTCIIARKVI